MPVVYMRLHLAVALLLTVAEWMIHILVRGQLHPVTTNLRMTSRLLRLSNAMNSYGAHPTYGTICRAYRDVCLQSVGRSNT